MQTRSDVSIACNCKSAYLMVFCDFTAHFIFHRVMRMITGMITLVRMIAGMITLVGMEKKLMLLIRMR